MSFLGFSVMDRPVVPLIVVIDNKGMIRAESPPQGDPDFRTKPSCALWWRICSTKAPLRTLTAGADSRLLYASAALQ